MNAKIRREIKNVINMLDDAKNEIENYMDNELKDMTMSDIVDMAENLGKISESLEDVPDMLDEWYNDEQEKLDNMPDSFRDSERGDRQEAIVDYLDTANGCAVVDDGVDLNEWVETLQECMEHLQDAIDA